MLNYYKVIIFLLVLQKSTTTQADVVWPALYLEERLFSWWAIGLGLLIEFLFIWKIFHLTAKEAFLGDIIANAASSLLGLVLIPFIGMVWEIFPGSVFNYLFNYGSFNPLTWAVTFVLACLINAWVENSALQKFFKLPFTIKTFLWLMLANSFSVGIAISSLLWKPVQL